MTTGKRILYCAITLTLCCATARADQPLTDAVKNCRDLIVAAQLEDGAIRMNSNEKVVNVMPYFSNLAAMALLADGQTGDVPRVGKWIQWYADHQEKDGTMYDYQGTIDKIFKGKDRDSTDSYAATYLMVLWRYSQATGDRDAMKKLIPAAHKAVDAIALTQDAADGSTLSKPQYPFKYLMDNLEVSCGLGEGAKFFDFIGVAKQARRCRSMRLACDRGLKDFWVEKDGCFAWAKAQDGTLSAGLKDWYPDGMANQYAAALVEPTKPILWDQLQKQFPQNPDANANADWWLRAALKVGTKQETSRYREQTIAQARAMDSTTPTDRAAWVLLGICWERGKFPTVELNGGQ